MSNHVSPRNFLNPSPFQCAWNSKYPCFMAPGCDSSFIIKLFLCHQHLQTVSSSISSLHIESRAFILPWFACYQPHPDKCTVEHSPLKEGGFLYERGIEYPVPKSSSVNVTPFSPSLSINRDWRILYPCITVLSVISSSR
jgi:hypothetical protein